MSCTITPRKAGAISVYDIAGRMSFPDPHIHQFIDSAIAEGCRGFVINLKAVTYLDSYGLHDIIMAFNAVTAAGGRLALAQPIPNVRKVIEITMKQTLALFDDEESAIGFAKA